MPKTFFLFGYLMPAFVVVLILISALFHASWNALLHRSEDPSMSIVVSYLSFGVFLSPALIIDPPTEVIGWALLSGLFHAVYITMLSFGYQIGSLGIVYPISRGVAPLLVALGGWVILNETPSMSTTLGLFLLTSGLMLIAVLAKNIKETRAVMIAFVTGVSTVGYSLIDAHAVDFTGALGYLSLLVLIGSSVVLMARRPPFSELRKNAVNGVIVGVLQGAAYALILLAFQRAQAGQVAGLRQVSVIFGTLIAREALGRRALSGSFLVALGAALVIW
ncbi:MAG: hypothetical protein QGF73_03260 [Acidimicrobiales bacterium]|nr:hypothetical protein [Acidimicrobiales bacterium]